MSINLLSVAVVATLNLTSHQPTAVGIQPLGFEKSLKPGSTVATSKEARIRVGGGDQTECCK